MKKFLRDYRSYICFVITVIFCLLTVFVFSSSFVRIKESGIDIKNSFLLYLNEVFGFSFTATATINSYSVVEVKLPFNLPNNWEDFKIAWQEYWKIWATKENFIAYLDSLRTFLTVLSKFLLIVIPIIFLIIVIKLFVADNQNNNYNEDTKALKRYKKFEEKVIYKIRDFFISFNKYLQENTYWKKMWLFIWAYNFNFFVIGMEFLAYYFYFVSSLELVTIYIQFVKLIFDLCAMLNFIPWYGWVVIGYLILDKIRKNIAYNRLEHWEMKNRGFINSLPLVVMGCGTMGSKKTTMITDMGLSQEVMFRDKAFEKILENDLKFPNFPWINLENAIKRLMEKHVIYNLATVKTFIENLTFAFESLDKTCKKAYRRHLKKLYNVKVYNLLFDYDFDRYGLYYDDKLQLNYIWDVIKNYAQLYFIYIIQSSLLISNYSIRTDNVLSDVGNFPLWDTDFFKRDSRLIDSFSRHAHILDFDALRLGRKVLENNPLQDSFEFGIVLITEVGKERGNAIELLDKKKNSSETNQKNDLFDNSLKMVRHLGATVDNTPFVRIFTDEQRPESWGANSRDLCNILNMEQSSDITLAMPFFAFGELFYDIVFNKFKDKYYEYRFNRGDNTLPMYLLKNLISKFHQYYKGLYNRFGYMDMAITLENGTQDGQVKKVIYKLSVKKIYSKRFSTDCHSGFFYKKAKRSLFGINDLIEYATEKATFDELKKQNSYFIDDLMSGLEEFEKI